MKLRHYQGVLRLPPPLAWRAAHLSFRVLKRAGRVLRRSDDRAAPPIDPERLHRIVVHAPNWLGDAVMSLPLVDHLHAVCPAASISVISRTQFAGLWRLHPHVDEVIAFDIFDPHLTWGEIAALVLRLRGRAPDAAFILPGGIESALFHALAGIRIRVGYDYEHRTPLLTHPLRVPPEDRARTRHCSENYLHLGHVVGPVGRARPRLRPTTGDRRDLSALALAPAPGRPRVLLHPWTTYGQAKRWAPARFAELGERLATRFRAEIVLVGTADARGAAAEIHRLMRQPAVDLTGQTSIAELCALMRGAALVISNDSGPAHLADALDVPLVVLFGSSSPTWTAPRGERTETIYHALDCSPCFHRTCPLGTYACLEGITVDEVFERVERLLARDRPTARRTAEPSEHP